MRSKNGYGLSKSRLLILEIYVHSFILKKYKIRTYVQNLTVALNLCTHSQGYPITPSFVYDTISCM